MDKRKYSRHSIRLQNYDYTQIGFYFITICVQNKACIFGNIKSNKMLLSDIGELVKHRWLDIPHHFSNVLLHEYVVMPNHIHGIIEICRDTACRVRVNNIYKNEYTDTACRVPTVEQFGISEKQTDMSEKQTDTACRVPTVEQFGKPVNGSIPTIIRSYKSAVTKQLHKDGFIGQIWQRNFYEHIIRNENDYQNITKYIINNPINWEKDKLYNI